MESSTVNHARREGTVPRRRACPGGRTAAVTLVAALALTGCGTTATTTTTTTTAVGVPTTASPPLGALGPNRRSGLNAILPDLSPTAAPTRPAPSSPPTPAASPSASASPAPSPPPDARRLTVDISPWGDATVGIGQPIVVTLSAPVTDPQGRAAVERALVVRTSQDVGPASWAWISSTRLDYRPQDFWPSGTAVTVDVRLAGVRAGDDLWGDADRQVRFSIGRSFVLRIDDTTHRMTVVRDGVTLRTIPVSMGRKGYETRSGIKTVMSHERRVRMTSESYGGADYYDEIVDYAQRLTWSGEYIHSAPWSVYAQGKRNVSHGCVNVSPAHATWLFGQTLVGDPVITTGTKRQMEPGNGDGGVWQYTWAQWTAMSALTGTTPAAPGTAL